MSDVIKTTEVAAVCDDTRVPDARSFTGVSVAARWNSAESRSILVQRPSLLGEIVIMVGLVLVYDRIRNLAPLHVDAAVNHGLSILRWEGPLAWERAINHWFARHDLLGPVSVWYYQFLHLTSALAVLAWCYVRRFDLYRPIRNSLLMVNLAGFVVFALYPVAPPRLLPGRDFLDLVATAGYGTEHGPLPMNAYAAMPSLHLAWAVCIALVGVAMSRRFVVRSLFIAHPVLTGLFVVATANHYLLDIAGGVALALIASSIAGLWIPSPFALAGRGRFQQGGSTVPPTSLISKPATAEDVASSFTLVSFHAHPDDETLFTGGTLARATAEGHRVVVVVATLGEAGLTGSDSVDDPGDLGDQRRRELDAALAELGVHRWEWLGYADSGRFGEVSDQSGSIRQTFVEADVDEAAQRLAAILRDENADVLTTYDSVGGYGHPDHVRVHEVGARAARLAGTPTVLEATVDRRRALALSRLVRFVPRLPNELRPNMVSRSFASGDQLTHRIDVTGYLDQKRAAMSAHASQQTGGDGPRSLAIYLRLPRPVFRKLFGAEWFVEVGRNPAEPLLDDVFASTRQLQLSAGSSTNTTLDTPSHDARVGVG